MPEFFERYNREVKLLESFKLLDTHQSIRNMQITEAILDKMLHEEFLLSSSETTDDVLQDQIDLDIIEHSTDLVGHIALSATIEPLFDKETLQWQES